MQDGPYYHIMILTKQILVKREHDMVSEKEEPYKVTTPKSLMLVNPKKSRKDRRVLKRLRKWPCLIIIPVHTGQV